VPLRDTANSEQPRFIHNTSGRFESRWTQVKVLDSSSIFFKGMIGSTFGVHVAHGEGRLYLPNPSFHPEIRKYGLAPLAYVTPDGEPTEAYPYNPNGSPYGYAGLSSPNGRHLAMMPHPERGFLKWQWHWMPEAWKDGLAASPWLRLFQNARRWCDESSA
jgi:phosphoribosylformylglycinamidine synthase